MSEETAALVAVMLSATFAEATFCSCSLFFCCVFFFSGCSGGLWEPVCLEFALSLFPHCVSWTSGTFSYTFDT